MKTIKLNRMELSNFKGVQQAAYDFSDNTNICGGNGTGKSTIYEAYLWCLFDKNQSGNSPKVQPLDENNEVRHKLTTSVKLYLTIDGNPLIVERTLKENWVKPRGTTELVCNGTTSEYTVNEVPMTKTQFTAKLTEILPLDRWFTISSINIVPAMEQKVARAALQSIAPAIDEKQLAEPFPAVKKAMQDGISIDELQAMVKQGKKQAQQELDDIPSALEAQDRLRVDDDFDLLNNSVKSINEEIAAKQAEIDEAQKQTIDKGVLEKIKKQEGIFWRAEEYIATATQHAMNDGYNRKQEMRTLIATAQYDIERIQRGIESDRNISSTIAQDIERYRQQIAGLRTQWQETNAQQYQEPQINGVCPTCGQPLPDDHIAEACKKAREEWNALKAKTLQDIQKQAEGIKARIDELTKQNAELQSRDYSSRIDHLQKRIAVLQAQEAAIPDTDAILAQDKEYQQAVKDKSAAEAQIAALRANNQQDEQQTQERIAATKAGIATLTAERDSLLKRLAGRDTNARIDAERKRLENEQSDLANLIAEYEGKEAQITAFRKAKITAVEEGVSSLFTMVHWKMYEPNLTNDGEKEICQAIINGVPYEQQNTATRVNAGIDICNGFAKAYGVSAPLFIDNAESVTNTLPTNGQSIKLTVVAGSELKIY